jgi:hypothetical protein
MEPLPWYRIAAPPKVLVALAVYALFRPSTRTHSTLLGAGFLSAYGIIQDQFSARICPEYFTVLHNPIPGLTDPTLLGIAWGFLASAGGGIAMGYVAGLAATLGPKPAFKTSELVRPMFALVLAVAFITAVAGWSAYATAMLFNVRLDPFLGTIVPEVRHRGLLVVATYHRVAYLSASIGSVVLCIWIGRERSRRVSIAPAI